MWAVGVLAESSQQASENEKQNPFTIPPPLPQPQNEKQKCYVVKAVIKAISSSGFQTPSAVGSKACLSAKTKHKEAFKH